MESRQAFAFSSNVNPSIHYSQDSASLQFRQFRIQGTQVSPDLNEPGTHLKQIPPSKAILESSQTQAPFSKVLLSPQSTGGGVTRVESRQAFAFSSNVNPSIHYSQDSASLQFRQFRIQGTQVSPDLNEPGTHLKQIPPSKAILESSQTQAPFSKVLLSPQSTGGGVTRVESRQAFAFSSNVNPSIHYSQDSASLQFRQFRIQGTQVSPDLNEPGTHLKQIPPSKAILESSQTQAPFSKVLLSPQSTGGGVTRVESRQAFAFSSNVNPSIHYSQDSASLQFRQFRIQGTQVSPDLNEPGTHLKQIPPSKAILESSQTQAPFSKVLLSPQSTGGGVTRVESRQAFAFSSNVNPSIHYSQDSASLQFRQFRIQGTQVSPDLNEPGTHLKQIPPSKAILESSQTQAPFSKVLLSPQSTGGGVTRVESRQAFAFSSNVNPSIHYSQDSASLQFRQFRIQGTQVSPDLNEPGTHLKQIPPSKAILESSQTQAPFSKVLLSPQSTGGGVTRVESRQAFAFSSNVNPSIHYSQDSASLQFRQFRIQGTQVSPDLNEPGTHLKQIPPSKAILESSQTQAPFSKVLLSPQSTGGGVTRVESRQAFAFSSNVNPSIHYSQDSASLQFRQFRIQGTQVSPDLNEPGTHLKQIPPSKAILESSQTQAPFSKVLLSPQSTGGGVTRVESRQAFAFSSNVNPSIHYSQDSASLQFRQFRIQGTQVSPDLNEPGTHLKQIPPSKAILESSQTQAPFSKVLLSPQSTGGGVTRVESRQAFAFSSNVNPSIHYSQDSASLQFRQFRIQGTQVSPDLNEPGTHLKQIPPSKAILESSQTQAPFSKVLLSPQSTGGGVTRVESRQAFAFSSNVNPSIHYSQDSASLQFRQFRIQGTQVSPDLNEPGTHLKQIPPSKAILESSQTQAPFSKVLLSPQSTGGGVTRVESRQAFAFSSNVNPSIHYSQDSASLQFRQFRIQGTQVSPDLNEPGTHLKQIPPSKAILESSQTQAPFSNVLFSPHFSSFFIIMHYPILFLLNPSIHLHPFLSSFISSFILLEHVRQDFPPLIYFIYG